MTLATVSCNISLYLQRVNGIIDCVSTIRNFA
jgi:hypothetical protein